MCVVWACFSLYIVHTVHFICGLVLVKVAANFIASQTEAKVCVWCGRVFHCTLYILYILFVGLC